MRIIEIVAEQKNQQIAASPFNSIYKIIIKMKEFGFGNY